MKGALTHSAEKYLRSAGYFQIEGVPPSRGSETDGHDSCSTGHGLGHGILSA
jgi:hypothetical protein